MTLPACGDAVDGDGDGLAGFPTDPGCTSANDPDETDDCPAGPNCPQCGNDLDDDGDGALDYPMDPACLSAATATEFPINVLQPGDPCGSTGLACPAGYACVGNCSPAACNDSIDADGDGLPGYPTDPGCTSISDTTETDDCPSGPQCPQCSNGQDDDGDLHTDYPDDLGCAAASGPSELPVQAAGPGERCNPVTASCALGYACLGPSGAEICVVAACNDAIDADGDGFPGYPTDPGCVTISDNDESDVCPSGPGCPRCSNDLDDDGDSTMDYPADASCVAASGDSEADCVLETDPLLAVLSNTAMASTLGSGNNLTPTCGAATHTAPDRVHILSVRVPVATLVIGLTPDLDAVLSVMDAACGMPQDCTNTNAITRTNVPAGTYAIVVDGFSSASGAYVLAVSGTIEDGGLCGDPLVQAGVLTCNPGFTCLGAPGLETCTLAACNDSIDADGDGHAGYPFDPGCASPSDNTESDDCPNGPQCPQCSDGMDNDADGYADYQLDPGCLAASDPSEQSPP